MTEVSRRAVLAAAWSSPVIVVAAATPAAVASGAATTSMAWSPDSLGSTASILTLTVTGDILPSTDDYVLRLSPMAGYPLAADVAYSGTWGVAGATDAGVLTIVRPGGRPITSEVLAFTITTGSDPSRLLPTGYEAVLTQGAAVIATVSGLPVGTPSVFFDVGINTQLRLNRPKSISGQVYPVPGVPLPDNYQRTASITPVTPSDGFNVGPVLITSTGGFLVMVICTELSSGELTIAPPGYAPSPPLLLTVVPA
jgi:hypothetical protein